MQAVLARIDAVNPAVNAYVTVARESALAAARTATRALSRKGAALPPLHGVPVAIKDLTATKGIRTTLGSLIYEHHVPTEDDLSWSARRTHLSSAPVALRSTRCSAPHAIRGTPP